MNIRLSGITNPYCISNAHQENDTNKIARKMCTDCSHLERNYNARLTNCIKTTVNAEENFFTRFTLSSLNRMKEKFAGNRNIMNNGAVLLEQVPLLGIVILRPGLQRQARVTFITRHRDVCGAKQYRRVAMAITWSTHNSRTLLPVAFEFT